MTEGIREALDAAVTYLRANPDQARYTDKPATATLESGLRFRVDTGDGMVATDMPTSVGGGASAPSPGGLWRAGTAACVGTLIAMRAAMQGVELSSLEVTADSESDDLGILGIDRAVPAGPLSARVRVKLGSDGTGDEALREVVAWAVAHCPVTEALGRSVPLHTEVEIVQA